MQKKPNVAPFANLIRYTDVEPYEVIRTISDKTIEIREMDAVLDPSWKREMLPGGFLGHTINHSEQRWIITSNPNNWTLRIRLRKNGRWYGSPGMFSLANHPVKRYDFNF